MILGSKIYGTPPTLTEAQHDEAVIVAGHINDLLLGIGTHSAVWALGYSVAIGALHQDRANKKFPNAGMQFIADSATIATTELIAQLEAEEQENGS